MKYDHMMMTATGDALVRFDVNGPGMDDERWMKSPPDITMWKAERSTDELRERLIDKMIFFAEMRVQIGLKEVHLELDPTQT